MSFESVCILPQQLYIGVTYDADSDSYVLTQFDDATGQDAAITIRAWNIEEFLSSLESFRKTNEASISVRVERHFKQVGRDA